MFPLNEERRSFLSLFLRNPKQIGSVTPSSSQLALKMVNAIHDDSLSTVVELGAGTGAITRALADRVREDTNVILFEKEPELAAALRLLYPDYPCYPNAEELVDTLHSAHLDQVDCILSGLPFFNFSPALRERLLDQIFAALKPGGQFIAFQYSLQLKRHLTERFDLEAVRFVPVNVPPAFVYCCRKGTGEDT